MVTPEKGGKEGGKGGVEMDGGRKTDGVDDFPTNLNWPFFFFFFTYPPFFFSFTKNFSPLLLLSTSSRKSNIDGIKVKCTITLQDVEVLVGLPADGELVIGQMHVCQELLGVIPPPEQIRGQRLSLTWLGQSFMNCLTMPMGKLSHLMGGSIFADKSTRYVHLMFLPFLANLHHTGRYSWGGACLAWLYRQLCKTSKQGVREIAGPLILLQIWAWERFPIVAPQLLHVNPNQLHSRAYGSKWRDQFCVTISATHVVSQYRYMFDLLQPSQIVWEPYKTVIDSLPHFCTNGHDIWRTISSLICFYIGEWHHPDRVLRQFGIQQAVPRDCNTKPLLHNINLRTADWSDKVAHLVMRWHNCRRFTAIGPPIEQFDMDRSNNIRLQNVADDPQQVLNICNDNEQYMENIHYMYDVPIVPAPVQRRRPLVQEPDQLEEVDQHGEEVPPMTQTQTQSQHNYVSPVMMMPTFGTTYYDSRVGQSSDFGRGYYNSEAGQSSTDFGQQYYDLGSDPSSSYMHGHGRGRGEHNEYLHYEVPAAVPKQSDEQQQQENAAVPEQSDEQQQQKNQEEIQQQRVQSRRRQPARNRRRPGCGTH
uniref:Aminotransferase-like plant mobile domain-containing protein n=1 Tax=Cucumis melo TaxID=3656 RepID=A0A9I9D3T2_CUCME